MAEYTYRCQHCGDDVTSPRRRSGAVNCTPCARLKQDAYDGRRFSQLMAGFESGTERGLSGVALREYALDRSVRGHEQARDAYARDVAEREAAKAERARVNALLRQHGYRWSKFAIGSEDSWAGEGSVYGGVGEEVGFRWILIAPDGHTEVSVGTALAQIETGSIPTPEGYRAERDARRQRVEDLIAAGFVPNMDAIRAHLAGHTADSPAREEAGRDGYHWHDFGIGEYIDGLGKAPINQAAVAAIITGDRAALLHRDDLPALAAAYDAAEREEEARYRAWRDRRDAQRAQDAADLAAGWDGVSIRPHEREALNAIFGRAHR